MGKVTGFLEIVRQDRRYAPAGDRIRHWRSPAAVTLVSLTFFAAIHTAHACECPNKRLAASELLKPESIALAKPSDDAALFVGRVMSQVQAKNWEPIVTTFEVMNVVRGDLPPTISLTGVTADDNSCGLPLSVSQIGLFFIWKNSERKWFASVCSQPIPDVEPGVLVNFPKKR